MVAPPGHRPLVTGRQLPATSTGPAANKEMLPSAGKIQHAAHAYPPRPPPHWQDAGGRRCRWSGHPLSDRPVSVTPSVGRAERCDRVRAPGRWTDARSSATHPGSDRRGELYRGDYLDDCPYHGDSAFVAQSRSFYRATMVDVFTELSDLTALGNNTDARRLLRRAALKGSTDEAAGIGHDARSRLGPHLGGRRRPMERAAVGP